MNKKEKKIKIKHSKRATTKSRLNSLINHYTSTDDLLDYYDLDLIF